MENIIERKISKNIDMTTGNPIKAIILFSLPLLLGNVFQQLYNMVDSIVVGAFVGDNAMGAVSSSGSMIMLLIGLIQGVSAGAGIVIAQRFGARDKEGMRRTIHTTVLTCLILSVFLTIFGIFMSKPLLILIGTNPEILPYSIIYFRLYFSGVLFTIMYNCGSAIFRAIGDSRHPLYHLIISSIVNVFLDLLFVGVFKWGIRGVGYATILSQALSSFLTFRKLLVDKTDYQVKVKELKLYKFELKEVIRYGIPAGLQNSLISLANVFILSNVNTFGNIAQSGFGAYTKIEGFATMPSGSFSIAISTYIGQNIGAKDYKRAKNGGYQGVLLSVLVTGILGVLLYIFAPFLVMMFTRTEEVIDVTVSCLRVSTLFFSLLAYSHAMSGLLRGAGYNKTSMVTMLLCWVLVRIIFIPVALSIPGWNKVTTIIWFYPFTWTLSTITLTLIAIFSRWAKPKDII